MKNKLNILLICVLVLISGGCQTYDTSTTNQEQIQLIQQAEQVQIVYWLCYENPNLINANKSKWISTYGKENTEKGIELYMSTLRNEIIEDMNINSSSLSESQKLEINKAIQNILKESNE